MDCKQRILYLSLSLPELAEVVYFTTNNDIHATYTGELMEGLEWRYKNVTKTIWHRVLANSSEVIIDNLLYQYGLVHAYERKIIIGDEEVLSDFYLPAGKVYIEFWGLENDPKYLERKKKKIEFYKKNDIALIELTDDDILSLDDHLPRKLKNYGIKVY